MSLTIPIVGLTMLTGYYLNKDKKKSEKIGNINSVSSVDRPNGSNIYNSNRVNEVENEILQKSVLNYKKSKNPGETGILPAIYNSYSVDYNTGSGITNTKIQGNINDINKIVDVKSGGNTDINTRPMFKAPNYGNMGNERDYYSYSDSEVKIDEQKSLLTGLPLDISHSNMVPFFGSNVKQNIEKFTNEHILDNYVGKSNILYKPKKEIGRLFSEKEQDIHGTPILTNQVETDRFIKSIYRQSEKPFEDIKVPAPIAGTYENKIVPKYLTIDQIRIGNRTQETFEGRTIAGQQGEVRGINGEFKKNKPDTFYEKNQDHLFKTTGAHLGKKMGENYSNLQQTNRDDYNLEYFGISESMNDNPRQRLVLDKNCDIDCYGDSMVQSSTKTSFGNDYSRNITGNKSTTDYGKSAITEFGTERGNEGDITNVNRAGFGMHNVLSDNAKTTIKETTMYNKTGNVRTQFDMGAATAYNEGITDISVPTTHKETVILNDYLGNANKEDSMGYLVNKYDAKTTGKEIISANSEYSGNANWAMEDTSRENYKNAETRDTKEVVAKRKYDAGPQKFNIAGSKTVVGDLSVTQTKQLTTQQDYREKLNQDLPQIIPTKQNVGVKTRFIFDDDRLDANNRFVPDMINSITDQFKNNPFSIYEKP